MTACLFLLRPPGVKCRHLQSVLFFYTIRDCYFSKNVTKLTPNKERQLPQPKTDHRLISRLYQECQQIKIKMPILKNESENKSRGNE